MSNPCPKCRAENSPGARYCEKCGYDGLSMKCPQCGTDLMPGYIAPVSGHGGGYIQWFDSEPNFPVFLGQGEQLTNPPIMDQRPYGNRRAFRCKACQIVVFRY